MLDNCYEIPKCNQRKRDRRSHMRLMLIGGYATGLRIDELLQYRGMLRIDDAKRIGVIKLVMNDSRNKINSKTVDISTLALRRAGCGRRFRTQ